MAGPLPDLPQTEIVILELTNAFRRENRLGEVKASPELTTAARAYAEFLARSTTFSHTADGRRPADRAAAAGYKFCQISENLALTGRNPSYATRELATAAVDGWKGSPGHRKNMLEPLSTEIGVAVAKMRVAAQPKDADIDRFVSVQLFARPEALKNKFRLRNETDAVVTFSYATDRDQLKPGQSVEFSDCVPRALVVESAKAGQRTRRIQSRFEPRSGDSFVIKGALAESSGAIAVEVERQPATPAAAAR